MKRKISHISPQKSSLSGIKDTDFQNPVPNQKGSLKSLSTKKRPKSSISQNFSNQNSSSPISSPKMCKTPLSKRDNDLKYTSSTSQININCTPKSLRVPPNFIHSIYLHPKSALKPKYHDISCLQSQKKKEISSIVRNAPISPNDAKSKYSSLLTLYEKSEILQFSEIYYLGIKKMKINGSSKNPKNFGYDDYNNQYKAMVGDHIAYRFEIESILGKGAFGEVLKCLDHKTKNHIALKIIVNTPTMNSQGNLEVSILQLLSSDSQIDNAHIIKGIDFFNFRHHICITFPILGQNLYQLSRSLGFRPMPIIQIKNFAKQMLCALNFCHMHNIIHCDIKPENILLLPGSSKIIQIIDFGSSCEVGKQKFDYVQSRFYRAPEVILGIPYGPPIDIWSFGCVIAELILGKPLFTGCNEVELLDSIMEVLGKPSREIIMKGKLSSNFFLSDGRRKALDKTKKQTFLRRKKIGSLSLSSATKVTNGFLLDLLSKCFTWDQSLRITASQALQHPWFK